MAVEIRELVIRAVVDTGDRGRDPDEEGGGRGGPDDREAIVQACVRQVLRILEKARER
jgi:hypothetical protein